MPDRSDVVLLYDGSFDGFLSAVFVSYLHRPAPLSVEPQDGVQQQFGVTYLPVETDDAQAQRTAGGIRRIMGQEAYETVWKAFLAESPSGQRRPVPLHPPWHAHRYRYRPQPHGRLRC